MWQRSFVSSVIYLCSLLQSRFNHFRVLYFMLRKLVIFLHGPLSHIHLRINISQRVKVIISTNTWYHRSAKEHIPLKFQLYSSFKTQRRNDCTKSGSRVLTFPYYIFFYSHIFYGILGWGSATDAALKPIQVLQNKVLRITV